jgi:hypothetical protein
MRTKIIEELEMLSSASKQLEYETTLAAVAGDAPTELAEVFCTDLFNLKNPELISAFSNDELKMLAHLYGLVVEATRALHPTVTEMLKDPAWRRVMSVAKDLRAELDINT